MEVRLNLLFLGVLSLIVAGLSSGSPRAVLDPTDRRTHELAALEDRFAEERGDLELARQLSERYLELDRPGLALVSLRSVDRDLLSDPLLSLRLAQAYERLGRVQDALATADLALSRCGRSLGARGASAVTPIPRHACTERQYALLDIQRTALLHLVRWRVSDPRTDGRTRTAYELAVRRARLASAPPH